MLMILGGGRPLRDEVMSWGGGGGGVLMMRLVPLYERPESSPLVHLSLPRTQGGHETGPSQEVDHTGTLISDFQTPEE